MPHGEDGLDTLTIQEPIELDVTADGHAPFRCPVWFDDEPDAATGEHDPIQAEFLDAISYWRQVG